MGPRASAFAALLVLVSVTAALAWGFNAAYKNDAKITAHREALPSMTRTGEVAINNTTLYFWAFEFEGKQCLWATGRSRGGLTCWEKKR